MTAGTSEVQVLFEPCALPGVWLIVPVCQEDERGGFGRLFCAQEFGQRGLEARFVQCSTSFNRRAGTLRGMHYQVAPHEETKLVRCTMGAIYDVLVDLRVDSSTYRRWAAFTLTAANRHTVYIPPGVAHGFQTLTTDAEVFYQISEFYHPESARGVRWNDAAFGINWPDGERILSARDASFPDYVPS